MVAILWGLFLAWSLWVAAVWTVGIGPAWLGFSVETPHPPNEDLRTAVLLLADNADVAWMVLAVMNLHLVITNTNGVSTARAWLGFTTGSAFVLGWINAHLGIPFGRLAFGGTLGMQFAGVPAGWLLSWSILVMSARESVLWARPKAGHGAVAALAAAAVFLTMVNIEQPARFVRGWWVWHASDPRTATPMPWWGWFAWLAWPWLAAFAMREKSVVSAAARRPVRPVVILLVLNGIALAARIRIWLG